MWRSCEGVCLQPRWECMYRIIQLRKKWAVEERKGRWRLIWIEDCLHRLQAVLGGRDRMS